MRNSEQARAFFDATVSQEYDFQSSYTAALIINVKLFRSSSMEGCLQQIMTEIRRAEEITKEPQTSLCNLLDRIFAKIDKGHKFWSPDSHWCTRLRGWKKTWVPRDGWLSTIAEHFQSSPCESFFSAASSHAENQESLAERYDVFPDFLGLAASFGLSSYVLYKLDSGEIRQSTGTLTNLLFCAVYPFGDIGLGTYGEALPTELIAELLKRGGKANMEVCSTTVWDMYLERLGRLLKLGIYARPFAFEPKILDAYSRAAMALLENQAVADKKTVWHQHLFLSGVHTLKLHVSVLAAIDALFRNQPNYAKLRHLCADQSGRYLLKCKTISTWNGSQCQLRFYKLSEQDSDDICAIWLSDLAEADCQNESERASLVFQQNVTKSANPKYRRFLHSIEDGRRGRFVESHTRDKYDDTQCNISSSQSSISEEFLSAEEDLVENSAEESPASQSS